MANEGDDDKVPDEKDVVVEAGKDDTNMDEGAADVPMDGKWNKLVGIYKLF